MQVSLDLHGCLSSNTYLKLERLWPSTYVPHAFTVEKRLNAASWMDKFFVYNGCANTELSGLVSAEESAYSGNHLQFALHRQQSVWRS